MKDGAIVSNSGHFNVEIDIPALEKMSSSKRTTRNFVEEYSLQDGRKINLLGEGRLINLAAAEGHPASVMDMSFADQALSVEYMVKNHSHAGEEGLHGSGRARQAGGEAEAGVDGHQDRSPDAGAGRVPGGLGGRNIKQWLVDSGLWLEGGSDAALFYVHPDKLIVSRGVTTRRW